jgi:hypothetical protein
VSMQPPTPSPARPARPSTRPPLVFLALAAVCVIAAGVGGYVAQSHRQPDLATVEAHSAKPAVSPAGDATAVSDIPAASANAPGSGSAGGPDSGSVPTPAGAPIEASAEPVEAPATTAPALKPGAATPSRRAKASPEPDGKAASGRKLPDAGAPKAARGGPSVQPPTAPPARMAEPAPAVEMPSPEPPVVAEAVAAPPAEPATRSQAQVTVADTFVIPADSVIGLELEHSISSETAQLEDRVDARVTRDVKIDGTTVIPAGSRVRGAVTRVENGGRFKERGRIEIRFHTLVLADGDTQSIATDTLFREGENVGRKTGARIGASAAGGAIIGAIFGGEKGAAIGAAAGAGAGTAATAAQKPSEARFRAGSVVTVRLTAPVAITVQQ